MLAVGRDLRATAALQQRLVEAQQAMERDYWKFRHAETRYRHLFQVASEAVLVVDASTQRILEANPAAARLIGDGGATSLVGLPFPSGVDVRSAEALNLLLAGVRATGRADECRAELLEARGEVTVVGVHLPPGPCLAFHGAPVACLAEPPMPSRRPAPTRCC